MSAPQPVGLTAQQHMGFAALEGALSWAVEELNRLAQGDEPVQGLTPAEWSELAEAAEQWRASITGLLDLWAKHRAGER